MKKKREAGLSNRDLKLAPRKAGLFWCGYCDAAKVGPGCRCPRCGRRQQPRRLKK